MGTTVGIVVGITVAVFSSVEVAVGAGAGIITVILGVLDTGLEVVALPSSGVLAGRTLTAYSPGSSISTSPTHTPLLPTVTV